MSSARETSDSPTFDNSWIKEFEATFNEVYSTQTPPPALQRLFLIITIVLCVECEMGDAETGPHRD